MISFLSTIAATPIATPTYTTSSDSQPTQSPITPTEGQGVKCSIGGNGDARELYRYTGGKLSWYPNPEIAASWDKYWEIYILVDCTQFPVSTPMIAAPHEGQAVKCSNGGNGNADSVYRFTKNKISWYPSPEVAHTWDSNWQSFVSIDCTNIVLGPNMQQQ